MRIAFARRASVPQPPGRARGLPTVLEEKNGELRPFGLRGELRKGAHSAEMLACSTASDPNDAEMTEVAWTAEPQWAPSRSGHPAAPPPTPFAASATRQPWLKVPLQSWSQPRPTPQPSSPSATRARASFCSPELLGAMTALGERLTTSAFTSTPPHLRHRPQSRGTRVAAHSRPA